MATKVRHNKQLSEGEIPSGDEIIKIGIRRRIEAIKNKECWVCANQFIADCWNCSNRNAAGQHDYWQPRKVSGINLLQ